MMVRVLCFVLMVVAAHHPKFAKGSVDFSNPELTQVTCSSEHSRDRETIIEQSKCRKPKEVLVYLNQTSAHEEVSPRAVFVKRCVGPCEFVNEGTCVAIDIVTTLIPVRIYNTKTGKDSCATYAVDEHFTCGCCASSPDECAEPRVFVPRKCACLCPNQQERRNCLRKRNQNMRWNRSQCACEVQSSSSVSQISAVANTIDY